MQQYERNGIPYIKQIAVYDEKTATCSYVYEPSFANATDPVSAA